MGCETVVYLHAQQRIRVLAVAPEELLYGGTHVVIGHHARGAPNSRKQLRWASIRARVSSRENRYALRILLWSRVNTAM